MRVSVLESPQPSARRRVVILAIVVLALLAGVILGLHAIVWFFTSSAWMMA